MLFDSPAFIVFLILVVLLYWRLSRRWQNIFLLGASYFLRVVGLAVLVLDGSQYRHRLCHRKKARYPR